MPLKRFQGHVQAARTGSPFALHTAIRKYGEDKFKFAVISTHPSEEEAFAAEIALIRQLDSVTKGYNMNEGGEGGFVPDEVTRQKISRANTGKRRTPEMKRRESEQRMGTGNPMAGRRHKPETLEKMRQKRQAFWDARKALKIQSIEV